MSAVIGRLPRAPRRRRRGRRRGRRRARSPCRTAGRTPAATAKNATVIRTKSRSAMSPVYARPHPRGTALTRSSRRAERDPYAILTRTRSGTGSDWWHGSRQPPHLPRGRARRRQDVRHAQRGAPAPRAGGPRWSSPSWTPTAGPARPSSSRPRGDPARGRSPTGARPSRRWTSTRCSPARPDVALVDELAHTNAPGSRNEKRWQDIDELLDAGIDVISTVNIQHLEGLNDVVEAHHRHPPGRDRARRLGARRRPDRAGGHDARGDPSPHGPRQHLSGRARSTPPSATTSARATCPRCASSRCCGWPTASTRRSPSTGPRHGIERPWETRERVVVALTGAPGGDHLVRRAARHGDPHPVRPGRRARAGRRRRAGAPEELLDAAPRRCWPSSAAGTSRCPARDVAAGAARRRPLRGRHAARARRVPAVAAGRAGQRLGRQPGAPRLGTDRRPRHQRARARERARPLAAPPPPHVRCRRAGGCSGGSSRSSRRWRSPGCSPRSATRSSSPRCCCCSCWSSWPSPRSAEAARPIVTAVSSSLYANWFFFPPLHTWTISDRDNVVALAVFILVGLVVVVVRVGWWPAGRARPTGRGPRPRRWPASPAAGAELDPLATLVEHLRDTFALQAVSVPRAGRGRRRLAGRGLGRRRPHRPRRTRAPRRCPSATAWCWRCRGRAIAAEDRHVMRAFAIAARRGGRGVDGSPARPRSRPQLGQADELRNALLAAVSHDLRTPLASIKASASSLLATDVDWSAEAVEAFASAIVEETDRLTGLVENLLDMSRLRAGAVVVRRLAVGAEELVPAALESLGDVARRRPIELDVPETLPRVDTDPALVERALVNLVANADRVGARRLTGADRGRRGRARPAHPRSSTAARACRRPTATASSSRSSGWATSRTAPGSVSASPWPGASSRRSEASSRPRTRRAAARRWSSRSRSGPASRRSWRSRHDRRSTGRPRAGGRRRAPDPQGAGRQPEGARLRDRPGRLGGGGPRPGGAAAPGRGRPRPRPAGHRRGGGDRGPAGLEPRPDHRAVGPRCRGRQDRRARRGRRRLRDQAVRHGRAAGPGPRGAAPHRRRRRRRDVGRHRRLLDRPRGQAGAP